jgi:hypothetical protein
MKLKLPWYYAANGDVVALTFLGKVVINRAPVPDYMFIEGVTSGYEVWIDGMRCHWIQDYPTALAVALDIVKTQMQARSPNVLRD